MKTLSEILPLHPHQILINDGFGYAIKRVSNLPSGLTAFTQPIHGKAARSLKQKGYVFLHESTWSWNAEGKIEGRNPSLPAPALPAPDLSGFDDLPTTGEPARPFSELGIL